MAAAEHHQCLVGRDDDRYPPPRRLEQRFAPQNGAELLGAIIAAQGSRERQESRPIATGENQGPARVLDTH
jgi:hypothetical protein